MTVPPQYRDREQTFLKHRVLKQYLEAWTRKLSSLSRTAGSIQLWYVDCFAGPWESQAEDRSDTSVNIGVTALEDALASWTAATGKLSAQAIFVEANPRSARALRAFLDARPHRGVEHRVLEGEFGQRAEEIDRLIGTDPAFVFVDPTGWKGAGMAHIAPVVAVLLAGYSFSTVSDILLPLFLGMRDRRVDATMFIHLDDVPGATPAESAELGAKQFEDPIWGFGPPLPAVYFDPRTVAAGSSINLHAKCLVVDDRWALVGSANFTHNAHARNIEVGALIDDVAFASSLARHWRGMVDAGLLTRLF